MFNSHFPAIPIHIPRAASGALVEAFLRGKERAEDVQLNRPFNGGADGGGTDAIGRVLVETRRVGMWAAAAGRAAGGLRPLAKALGQSVVRRSVVAGGHGGRSVKGSVASRRWIETAATTAAPAAAASAPTTTTAARALFVDGVLPAKRRVVGAWLAGCSTMVFGIVVLGGLTRLTESGLSIVDWRPLAGSIPPRTDAEWDAEFAKYQASPEYLLCVFSGLMGFQGGVGSRARLRSPSCLSPLAPWVRPHRHNSHMNVHDFKKIFWMEWAHRQVGRTIGLAFVLPAAYFIGRGYVSRAMALRLAGIGALIGTQVR